MNEPAPTPTPTPPANNGFDANQPTIIGLCYLGGFLSGGLTSLVGVVLAHIWQGDNDEEWAASHFSYLIRTFWFGFVGGIIAFFLTFVLIGLLLFPLLAIWVGVRSVMSLIKAQKREPMPDPTTLLF